MLIRYNLEAGVKLIYRWVERYNQMGFDNPVLDFSGATRRLL